MATAIVSRPVVSHTIEGRVDIDSWVVKVDIELHAKWSDGEATITRTYQLTTPRAIKGFDKAENDEWPIDEIEGEVPRDE